MHIHIVMGMHHFFCLRNHLTFYSVFCPQEDIINDIYNMHLNLFLA